MAAIEIQDAVSAPAGLPSVSEEETRPDPAPEPVHVIPEAQPIETVAQQQAPVAPPPPILQDPLRERVHLEDFLPFFTPPAPRAQPASSATYRRE